MPTLTLSGKALVHNFQLLKKKTEGVLIPVLKADAYGHGALFAARALSEAGASVFAVACAYEAKELLFCKELVTKPSILIMGAVEKDELLSLCDTAVTLSVHSLTYARALSGTLDAYKRSGLLSPAFTLAVHLKVETGMHRLGLSPAEARKVLLLPHLRVTGVYSHLAEASSCLRTSEQLLRFSLARRALGASLPSHLSASGALLRYGDFGQWGARVGLALYGVAPGGACETGLLPVMRFDARLLAVFTVCRGTPVGYGSTRAPRSMRLAVIDAGYADGIPLTAAQGGCVQIGKRRCPFFGEICMDRATLEIGSLPLQEGDTVPLFGVRAGDTAAFADAAHVSPYVLLSLRSARTKRILLP